MLRLYDTPVAWRHARSVCTDALHHDGAVPMIRALLTLAAGVLLGGIVHLVSVLVLPASRPRMPIRG